MSRDSRRGYWLSAGIPIRVVLQYIHISHYKGYCGICLGRTKKPDQQAQANGVHVLLVAHTVSEDEEQIRILSARKATRRERSMYAQSN
jgi:hypothetical protein